VNLRKTLLCLVAVVGVLCIAARVSADVAYTVTDLGPGQAYGINNAGQVVGQGAGGAFLYSNGTTTYLAAGNDSCAYGINNLGQVVGQAMPSGGGPLYGFLYSNGKMTNFGTGNATGINDSGQAVGYSYTYGYGFIFSNGNITNLGSVNPIGINNAGQIIGFNNDGSAFLNSNGTITNLGSNRPYGINNSGQVVGYCSLNGNAFLYSNGETSYLGLGTATAINKVGLIVGYFDGGYSPGTDAFIYSNGVMTDLNSLIDPASGWTLVEALGINDEGDIVGGGFSPAGGYDAFILEPVPEPASISLLGIGLIAIILRGRNRYSV
jgi:probable HAF family extracellular repeat protein